ncbi:CmcI family methyltransferase [Candidatus Entotheonella palauensis]|nr:CmcI family methyltransferase [Candidatus Entotheonella palauensis]
MEQCLDEPLRNILAIMQQRIVEQTTYFGVPALKSPLDYWVYQEIITEMRPDMIVEIGNHQGGSTLALAHLCDALGTGQVIGVDITHEHVPDIVRQHPRIQLIQGDACACFNDVSQLCPANARVLVIEDSSHTYANTLNVLRTYSQLVKVNDYFIVEDGICHHGVEAGPNPGPLEAVETFVGERADFEIDRQRESFVITWNPKGYLRRVAR